MINVIMAIWILAIGLLIYKLYDRTDEARLREQKMDEVQWVV